MALAPDLATDDPERVRHRRERPELYQYVRKPADHEMVVVRTGVRPEIRVGVMGDPARASAELGRRVVDGTVEHMSALFADLERRRTPECREVGDSPRRGTKRGSLCIVRLLHIPCVLHDARFLFLGPC